VIIFSTRKISRQLLLKGKNVLVTINTDASFRSGSAGYAFWIVCNAGKIQKAGEIKLKVAGINDAEMMCIANTIHTLKHSKFKEIEKVIINTDSQISIDYLSGRSRPKHGSTISNVVDETYFNMLEVCLKYGKSIREVKHVFEFRHVKAHSGKKDSRSYVNDWCDKESKKYCRQAYLKSHGTK
jgi:ribonuclease HI